MASMSEKDLATDIRCRDLQHNPVPNQRVLGISWDLVDDVFTFSVAPPDRPCTRRGMLSVVHSLYDPMGFVAPVTVAGKVILQEIIAYNRRISGPGIGWDDHFRQPSA